MKQVKLHHPPAHLSAKSKAWFREVVETWELDSHHVKLLTGCCESLDRATEAREAIAREGLFTKNRFGEIRKHPGIGVERDSMIVFARLLRELDLDITPPAEVRRPPGLLSIRGHHAS